MNNQINFLLLMLSFSLLFISCSKNEDDKQIEIQNKIKHYYIAGEAKDYSPISFSSMDTTYKSYDGEYFVGKVTHTFKAKNKNGELGTYSSIFKVTIFKKDVFVLPDDEKTFLLRGY